MKVLNFALIGIAMTAVLVMSAKNDAKMKPATHSDCVAYWTARTSTWDNAPSSETINVDVAFCGNVQ